MREYKLICEEQKTIYKKLFNFFVDNYAIHRYFNNHNELKWFSAYELQSYENSKEYTLKQDFVQYLRDNNLHITQSKGDSLEEQGGIYINPLYDDLPQEQAKELYKLDLERIQRNITTIENSYYKAGLRDDLKYITKEMTIFNDKGILQLEEEPQIIDDDLEELVIHEPLLKREKLPRFEKKKLID